MRCGRDVIFCVSLCLTYSLHLLKRPFEAFLRKRQNKPNKIKHTIRWETVGKDAIFDIQFNNQSHGKN